MRNKLYIVLAFHILLLLFQLSFRQLFFDTTFVRDFGLFLMCFIYIGSKKEHYNNNDTVIKMVKIYMLYGILMSIVHVLDGEDVLNVIVIYRNHFFPFILFFIALYLFQDFRYRKKWVDFLFVVFLILLVDVYVEKLMEITGISREILPWYRYQFAHYYRFTEDDAGLRIVTNPENSPVLGLLGWNNPTSCAIAALFSFFIPFLLKPGAHSLNLPKVAQLSAFSRIMIFILTIGALAILTIKTPFAAIAVVFFLYMFKEGNKSSLKIIIVVTVITALIAYLSFPYWGETYMELAEETKGEHGMSYIFDQGLIIALLGAAFGGSPLAFFFGTDISNNSLYSMLEVRIIVHTIQFGILWLFIYGAITIGGIKSFNRIRKSNVDYIDRLIATGAYLLIISYLVDFLHYAHAMFLFHLDILVVSIALIVSIGKRRKIYEN